MDLLVAVLQQLHQHRQRRRHLREVLLLEAFHERDGALERSEAHDREGMAAAH